jgi:hypothetical protein
MTESILRARDVFTPNRTPSHTFVTDHLTERREKFEDAVERGSTLISISGPSKSGKTAFVENLVGKENLLAITGANVSHPDDLWRRVFDLLGQADNQTVSSETNNQSTVTGGVKATGGFMIAKVEGSGQYADASGGKETVSATHKVDALQQLIRLLSGTDYVVFIDDFHYIAREIQEEVARQIKEAIAKEVRIVCASVPYHADDVLRANSDLRGRVVAIDFDYWTVDNLAKIAELGFGVLHLNLDGPSIALLADEAAGSPQLMQTMCLEACFESKNRTRATAPVTLPNTRDFINAVCLRTVATADYTSLVEKLKEGPKTRGTERTQHQLSAGGTGDVYRIVLLALSSHPPNLTFRYQELQDRIRALCADTVPSGSSVTGACEQIATIANSAEANSIIEWDAGNDVLDIRDPYLLYYLRWSGSLS